MAKAQAPLRRVSDLTLAMDWDGTMIQGSSLELIASINTSSTAPPFQYFAEAWENDMKRWDEVYASPRNNVNGELKYVASLAVVEKDSVGRMEAAGLWRGVSGPLIKADGQLRGTESPSNDVERHAIQAVRMGQLKLRPGVVELCQSALRNQQRIFVFSTSWSASWIAACLREFGLPAHSYFSPHASIPQSEPMILVLANEIDPQGSGHLSRLKAVEPRNMRHEEPMLTFQPKPAEKGIWTSKEKFIVMFPLLLDLDSPNRAKRLVYIGDSLNDFHGLLWADIKIHVVDKERTAEQQTLLDTLGRIRFSTSPSSGRRSPRFSGTDCVFVEDFADIARYLKDFMVSRTG
jgi:hypothetical protein